MQGHFAQFFGWFEDQKNYYLAMEYFEQGTLRDYLRNLEGLVPEPDTIEILTQLLSGIKEMHNMNYTHRDLKPDVRGLQ